MEQFSTIAALSFMHVMCHAYSINCRGIVLYVCACLCMLRMYVDCCVIPDTVNIGSNCTGVMFLVQGL